MIAVGTELTALKIPGSEITYLPYQAALYTSISLLDSRDITPLSSL